MRRPDRNIEIFSMSVLDMFASALGAFIMVSVILFPYYRQTKDFETELSKTKAATMASEQDLSAAKQRMKSSLEAQSSMRQQLRAAETATVELNQCRAEATACKASLRETFLVVSIEWSERCDVDLYIRDPDDHEYYFGNKTFSGSDAELSLDMTDGPGLEIWQTSVAKPGRYEISYKPLSRTDSSVKIKGIVMDRSTRRELPVQEMRCGSDKTKVAAVQVSASGSVVVQPIAGY
jgi:hypothetical protein